LYNSEQTGLLVDEMSSFVYTQDQPSLVDADRAMWDYNPILVSSYVNPGKAGHGRFYAGGSGIQIPAPGGYAGMKQVLKNYVVSRGAFIDSTILTDTAQIPTKPTITYTGATGYPLDGLQFTSSSFSSPSSSFAAMEWRIAEVYNPSVPSYEPGTEWKYEIESTWESGELATFDNTLDHSGANLQTGHSYRARVRMKDAAGRWSHWSAPVQFVVAPPSVAPTLVFTELHYHPNNPALDDESDQEFIEIKNVGNQAIDLTGVQITEFADPPYVFAGGTLQPGQYIVVARTPAVFTSIYGAGINLAPGGYGLANLSNTGETIALRDAGGALLASVTYGDSSPWPAAADGSGPSLQIIDASGNANDPANWRASAVNGGTPGRDDTPTPELPGDYDLSGVVDEQDYTVWRSNWGSSVPAGTSADGNGDGMVDAADYVLWRMNLGAQLAAAAAAVVQAPLERIAPSATQLLLQRASAIDSAMGDNARARTASTARAAFNSLFPHDDSRHSNNLLVAVTGGNAVVTHAVNAGLPSTETAVPEFLPAATTQAAYDLFASLDDEALSTWAGWGGLQ
jgi:hypothetical protein